MELFLKAARVASLADLCNCAAVEAFEHASPARAVCEVEGYLEIAMHDVFHDKEWCVFRSSGPSACVVRKGHSHRGLHVDSDSPVSFLRTYCAPAVSRRLLEYDDELLNVHVVPCNLWMRLCGNRALLLLPDTAVEAYRADSIACTAALEAAIADGRPLDHDAVVFPPPMPSVSALPAHPAPPLQTPLQTEPSRKAHDGKAAPDPLALLLFSATRLPHAGLSSNAESVSVDFRKIAIRRAATSWCGGPIDLTGLEGHLLSQTRGADCRLDAEPWLAESRGAVDGGSALPGVHTTPSSTPKAPHQFLWL